MSLVVFHDYNNFSTSLDLIKIGIYHTLTSNNKATIFRYEIFLNVSPLGKLQVYPPVSSRAQTRVPLEVTKRFLFSRHPSSQTRT